MGRRLGLGGRLEASRADGGPDRVEAILLYGTFDPKTTSKSARCCSLAGLKPGPYKKKQDAALKGRRYTAKSEKQVSRYARDDIVKRTATRAFARRLAVRRQCLWD